MEVLISDNASEDETERICREFASRDRRVRYLRHRQNRGAAWNHNVLIREARGRYFRFHSHDDLCTTAHLARCVEMLERNDGAVLCYPGTLLIDANGVPTGVYEDDVDLWEEEPSTRLKHLVDRLFLCNAVLGLIRLDVLRTTALVGNFQSADRVLLAELALRGKFCHLDELLFLRRIHPGKSTEANRSAREFAAWWDPARASRRLFFPRLVLWWKHQEAVLQAPITVAQRVRASEVLIRWAASRAIRAGSGGVRGRVRSPVERTRPAEPRELEHLESLVRAGFVQRTTTLI